MRKIIFALNIFWTFSLFAQSSNLTIRVETDNGESPEFATLVIKNSKDSSIFQNATFSENGLLDINIPLNKSYLISVSKFGYNTHNQSFTTKEKKAELKILLKTSATNLNEVTVVQKQKLMQQDDDKTIVDAEPLARIASNAFEVVEKVPGVIVVDDNVYLGKAEVAKIYINGREMKLAGSDLASILKSMPPNAIAKIEVMNTPSSKFDASSSGGIINIVLKKGVRLGTNGTANLNYNKGRFGRLSTGITLNHGDENQNFYLNYQYGNRNNFDSLISNRWFTNSRLLQQSYTFTPSQTHYAALGFDRNITKNINFSNDLIFNNEKFQANIQNESNILALGKDSLFSNIFSKISNNFTKNNINNTFNFTQKLDTTGGEWKSSLNYVYSKVKTLQDYETLLQPAYIANEGNGNIDNDRNFVSLTSDFAKKFAFGIKLETGLKLDAMVTKSNTKFLLNANTDDSKSTTYQYNENINAAYFQASKKLYGVIIKGGLRAENTNMKGVQTYPSDTTFNIKRTDFFPYLYLSRRLFSIFHLDLIGNLVVRRSITRPNYNQLNPSIQYTDPFYLQTGNPALQPQFTNTYEFNISYNDYPVLAFGTDETKNYFGKVTYQNPTTKIFTESFDNIGTLRQYYFRLVGGLPPGGKYFGILGMTYGYQIYQGLYQNEPLDLRKGTWLFFTHHELKFNKTSFMTLHGFLRLGGITNFYEIQNLGSLDLSFSKKIPKRNLQFIFSVNDIFYTMKQKFDLYVGGIDANGRRVYDTRRAGITIRYNFGVESFLKKDKEKENVFDLVNPNK